MKREKNEYHKSYSLKNWIMRWDR